MLSLPVLAAAVLVSGTWLARAGRPYGTWLVTVHKLAALIAVAVITMMVYRAHHAAGLSAAHWAIAGCAAASAVAATASGGAVTAQQSPPAWLVRSHCLTSWTAALAAGLAALAVSLF